MDFGDKSHQRLEGIDPSTQQGGLIIKKKTGGTENVFKKPSALGLDKLAAEKRKVNFYLVCLLILYAFNQIALLQAAEDNERETKYSKSNRHGDREDYNEDSKYKDRNER